MRERKKQARTTYCVFNKTREAFLSLNVTVADTHFGRLRGLLGKLRLKTDEGMWVIPSKGIHTIGLPFSIDLIYLDADQKVIHLAESFGSFRIAAFRLNASSVLELPTRTIYSSGTELGDELLICSAEDMHEQLQRTQISLSR